MALIATWCFCGLWMKQYELIQLTPTNIFQLQPEVMTFLTLKAISHSRWLWLIILNLNFRPKNSHKKWEKVNAKRIDIDTVFFFFIFLHRSVAVKYLIVIHSTHSLGYLASSVNAADNSFVFPWLIAEQKKNLSILFERNCEIRCNRRLHPPNKVTCNQNQGTNHKYFHHFL